SRVFPAVWVRPVTLDRTDPRSGARRRPDLCPETRGCRAGLVPDACGCCMECGNLEGQACDPGDRSVYYGLCGAGMRCQADPRPAGGGDEEEEEEEEEVCVCEEQEAVCGSDGTTFMNMCQFREAAFSRPQLKTRGRGPCKTVPVIKVPPQSQVNGTGSSLVFLCEVFAFPMALVEWRKEGRDVILPGDDPHISVQSRGGPLKFELSSWLQIEGAGPEDSGTYRCIARNNLGSVSAAAVLGILGAGETQRSRQNTPDPGDQQEYLGKQAGHRLWRTSVGDLQTTVCLV
uniref:Kazal-type serine peptidase inhibitor domain 3 n=1 Tax=Anabas testudineus TaxID=64144 RepID=A0AAQ6IV08_ANATE